MPCYPYVCPHCGAQREVVAPMRESGRRRRCPQCRSLMQREYAAHAVAVHAFQPYLASSGGAFEHEMAAARREGENYLVEEWDKDAAGRRYRSVRQLNPPGFTLDPQSGNVAIRTQAERRRYLDAHGYVDLRDVRNLREHNARESARRAAKIERLRKRIAAAAGRGIKPRAGKAGWSGAGEAS